MSKEAYYFSHDAGARRDPKIVQMMSVYGYEGYGWYWAIVEMMREEQGHKLDWTGKYFFQGLANELSTNAERMLTFVDDCVEEFKLFQKDDTHVWSESLLRRMKKYQNLIEQRREAGKKSAQKRKENKEKSTPVQRALKPKPTGAQQLKERKGKEIKEKDKENTPQLRDSFNGIHGEHQGLKDSWVRWIRFRKEIKKPLAPSTMDGQIKKLEKFSPDVAAVAIQNSIENGWQGLFPDKVTPQQSQSTLSQLENI
jgi:hypothetical protein